MVRLHTADELADISWAAWERMAITDRAAIVIEHFLSGGTFNPLDCGFCRAALAVIDDLQRAQDETLATN